MNGAEEIATRVPESFRAFAWPRRAVTVGIGVAQPAPGEHVPTLIERVDTALYEAKRTGRERAKPSAYRVTPATAG